MNDPRVSIAAVMPSPGEPVELRELPIGELERDSALLRVELSEVCGTDVYLQQGRLAGVPYPIIPGHVCVGILDRLHGQMLDVDGKPLAEGDRVTFLDVHKTCHRCWYCLVAKASTRCPHRKVYGITYGVRDGLTGGWSQYVYLKPGVRCIRMGDIPSALFMAGGCAMPTALHAVQLTPIDFADTVLVLGAGAVGLSAVALSTLRGAGRVLCIAAPQNRLAQAEVIGADATLDFTGCTARDRVAWVLDQTAGRGADSVIECTGAPDAAVQAMQFARDGGSVVIVGQYTDHGSANFNPHLDLNKKHLRIQGCWGSDYSHFHRAVELLRTKRAASLWSAFSVSTFQLACANDALAAVQDGHVIKALILPPS